MKNIRGTTCAMYKTQYDRKATNYLNKLIEVLCVYNWNSK